MQAEAVDLLSFVLFHSLAPLLCFQSLLWPEEIIYPKSGKYLCVLSVHSPNHPSDGGFSP